MLGRFIAALASLPGTKDDSTYIVQTLDFHLGHNTMVTKPCGALESPMATITKITRRRHENPPHGVATVKEWFNYVTAMRNEGSGEFLSAEGRLGGALHKGKQEPVDCRDSAAI